MKQVRWFCNTCKREWVFGSGEHVGVQWDGTRCWSPSCGSTDIRQVQFTAMFPGLDIPREYLTPTPAGPVVVTPVVNSTLAMSSPEFA